MQLRRSPAPPRCVAVGWPTALRPRALPPNMRGMMTMRTCCGRSAAGHWLAWLGLGVPLLACGCAGLTYDQIKLGQQLREFDRVFPEDRARRTESTVCFMEQSLGGQTEAVVVLITRDRRVSGKLHATHLDRQLGWTHETSYTLVGEIDPVVARLNSTGPADTLRAIADQLISIDADQSARDAHGWIAAGLVRLLQRWPHVGDEGPSFPKLPDLLERVPAGGKAQLSVDTRGAFLLEYTQSVQR